MGIGTIEHHFAADSLVGESMQQPAKYYQNNVVATLSLLETMLSCQVTKIVFSSTAAVYGEPDQWWHKGHPQGFKA